MAWPPHKPNLSHNPMRTKQCSGSLSLSSLSSALATYLLNLTRKLIQASGEGRGRLRCGLPLLFLLFFSSFSFGSSSIPFSYYNCGFSSLKSPSFSSACSASGGTMCSSSSYCSIGNCVINGSQFTPSDCGPFSSTLTCSIPSNIPVGSIGSSDIPNSSGVNPGTYCDPSDDCDTQNVIVSSNGQLVQGGSLSNGQACIPSTAPTSSSSVSGTSCPSGYSLVASGCACLDSSSGSAIDSTGSATDPACNGGSATAPTLSPVAPVDSNGTEVCPSGSDSISNSSGDISCYTTTVPPAVSSGSSGSVSNDGGSGGSSSFHDVPPVTNSQGQTVCPAGSSSISGSNGSNLTCIASGSASGSGTAPTSSGTSATSSTGSSTASTSSGPSYPTSVSMPSMPGDSVASVALGQIGSINETTSETCPAPITFSLMNTTFSIPFTYACNLAGDVRPIVIGVFSLSSLLLLVH